MIKKRRDFNDEIQIDIEEGSKSIEEIISTVTNTTKNNGITFTKNKISPKYGDGYIDSYETKNISLSICKYQLNKDLTFFKSLKKESIHLNFLLKGEKIINRKNEKEILFESRESFMTDVENFKGCIKILSSKPIKEIKISVDKSFLVDSGFFLKTKELKKVMSKNLISPITDDLLHILIQVENNIRSIDSKIYLKAKILELIAIKLNNYNSIQIQKIGKDKIFKACIFGKRNYKVKS